MALDKVKPLKWEETIDGNMTDLDTKEADPSMDYLSAAGISFGNSDTQFIDVDANGEMEFEDAVETSPMSLHDLASLKLTMFGDGSDGDVSLSAGTTTLSRTMYYKSLTLTSTAIINANGFGLFCQGTLAMSGSSSIINNGTAGSNASGTTAGSGGNGGAGADCIGGIAGVLGGAGGGILSNGGNSISFGSTQIGLGGAQNGGGAGGVSGARTGGTVGTGVFTVRPHRVLFGTLMIDRAAGTLNSGMGGTGGGGGAGAAALGSGGGGGGGGGSGGTVAIYARTFNNTSSTGITANGAAGGAGAQGGTNAAGGGGGGGGGGGYIFVVCLELTAAGTLSVAGGAGGTAGIANGTGGAGVAGNAGSSGHSVTYECETRTWTVV